MNLIFLWVWGFSKGKGRFGVARSFIATRSGLLRWHDHQQNDDILEDPDFPETYRRAIDSTWYKRSVDQHAIEPESFVYSVPFDAADNPRPLVTATHAIFVESKGHKAPAAVVGIQFHHSSIASHFINVTSACSGTTDCKKNCASDDLDCYILDNNGFIIISENHKHTGKFFGDIDGTIMDSLVQDKIFRRVSVEDYQGICTPQSSQVSAAPKSSTHSLIKSLARLASYLWAWSINLNLADALQPIWAYAPNFDNEAGNLEYPDTDRYSSDLTDEVISEGETQAQYPPEVPPPAAPAKATHSTTTSFPPHKLRICEKETDLYILQPDRLNSSGQGNPLKGKLTNCHTSGCERPFSVQKISHTNLILLVVDTLCPCGSKKLGIRPQEAVLDAGTCDARRERLYRRRPSKCINYHPEELEIKLCGRSAGQLGLHLGLLVTGLLANSLARIVSCST